MVKKSEVKEELIGETKEVTEEVKPATKTFKVLKYKNFVGFVHPETRKFITAIDGKIEVSASDKKAIAILEEAADLTEI
ncbi:hypothetical protein JKN54_000783 [Enterococcus faecalis]|nr:hypothetical protein [Enterococcus faecalis]EHB6456554.1 hypothetical protein [Enterococcus faecalis]